MPCIQNHPVNLAIRCDNSPGNHRLCTGYDPEVDSFVDWPNPDYVAPKNHTSRKAAHAQMEDVAARVTPELRVQGPQDLAQSKPAPDQWTEDQRTTVMNAIIEVARSHDEFTSAMIWERLGAAVPVTEELPAMMKLASRRGILDSTGKLHESGLTIWYSLLKGNR
jgi:hypothetical protein